MLYTVPAAAPEMFEAEVGQREVSFSWSPPPVTQRNGVITSYNLSCSPSPSSLPHQTPSGPLTVAGFTPDTAYSCSLVATNSQGSGPSTTTSFTTQQDCKTSVPDDCECVSPPFSALDSYFQLHLRGPSDCIAFVVKCERVVYI